MFVLEIAFYMDAIDFGNLNTDDRSVGLHPIGKCYIVKNIRIKTSVISTGRICD